MFRYPGGKSTIKKKLVKLIKCFLDINGIDFEFREPFFGGGSVGLEVLNDTNLNFFWFNDIDSPLIHLWRSVQYHPKELIEKIESYKPTVESFFEIKKFLEKNIKKPENMNEVDFGFLKLVIHQISYSGLGVKAGGPIGGVKQQSDYDVGCRWNPKSLKKTVEKWNMFFSEAIRYNEEKDLFTNLHFKNVISYPGRSIIYLDPPYYIKGGELYQHSFSEKNHIELKKILKSIESPWVLSYDDCEEIRDLYSDFADINSIEMIYSINTSRKKSELVITSKSFDIQKIDKTFQILKSV